MVLSLVLCATPVVIAVHECSFTRRVSAVRSLHTHAHARQVTASHVVYASLYVCYRLSALRAKVFDFLLPICGWQSNCVGDLLSHRNNRELFLWHLRVFMKD